MHEPDIVIALAHPTPQRVEVTATGLEDKTAITEYVRAMLKELPVRWPQVQVRHISVETLTPAPSPVTGKRGGPAGMPEDQKLEIIQGWFRVRGRVKQAVYARSQGISTQSLQRWIRELRGSGKL